MKNKVIFVSAIDTGIGKTFATGLLAKALLNKGKKIITQKMVQTGSAKPAEDIVMHRKLMQLPILPEDTNELTCLYVFKYPASPHLAAALDKQTIAPEKINQCTAQLLRNYEMVLLEGAGGLMVPITKDFLIINYIQQYKLPLILVTSPNLGSINHTLLNLQICRQQQINLLAIVYNMHGYSDKLIKNNTEEIIKYHLNKLYPDAFFLALTSQALENEENWENFMIFLET